ncbi:MAG: phosphoribosylformylglycinamidine synthase subunit PurS [Oscillospiraceae bacterium]|nr:phosphoribosylformylglycinamidine synthase subunit PurS [Oscillospiraceae bacterium]
MYEVKVFVTLKESIIDPAGTAVKDALHRLDFAEVQTVRVEKMIRMTIASTDEIEARIEAMCKALLVNTVMEDYRYEIEKIS